MGTLRRRGNLDRRCSDKQDLRHGSLAITEEQIAKALNARYVGSAQRYLQRLAYESRVVISRIMAPKALTSNCRTVKAILAQRFVRFGSTVLLAVFLK